MRVGKGFVGATLLVVALSLAACTEGPKFTESQAAVAPIPAGKGRISVLRQQQVQGFGVKPAVLVDGMPTGKCEVNSVFHVDVPPGTHTVSASTMETSIISVSVRPGETAYVLCTVEVAAVVGQPKLVQVSADSVMPSLPGMVFTGQYQPQ